MGAAMKRVAVYVRVSTATKSLRGDDVGFDQNPEAQEQPLRDLIAQRGWVLCRVYSDRASRASERRPGLDLLMKDVRRGKFDVLVVWRFDRFASSVKQLVLALEELRDLGIDFVSHQESLDTSTPTGKVTFTIIAAMAELERSVSRERVVAGLHDAQHHGTKSGRSVGRPKVVFRRDLVPELRSQGLSWAEIARRTGGSVRTIRRVLQTTPESAYPLAKTLESHSVDPSAEGGRSDA